MHLAIPATVIVITTLAMSTTYTHLSKVPRSTDANEKVFVNTRKKSWALNRRDARDIQKRLFDLAVAGLVSVTVLVWLLPLIGLLIKLTSRGPILFVQMRTGRDGKPFRCFKFRTMTHSPEAEFKQVTMNDVRVTKLGHVLRRSNLDEMPQFINVLLGHMSVVGPRPHPIPLDNKYWHTMPGYKERYTVRPGITGLAQARGARGETDVLYKMKGRVRYDHLYIRQQSSRLDMKICWWTVKAAINGNKNAR